MEKSITKLFVGGLPKDIDEIELVQLVAIYGDVLTIKVVRDRTTKKCKGYAFLEMASLQAAENVIESMDGASLGNKNLFFNIVQQKPVTNAGHKTSPKTSSSYNKVKDVSINKKKRPRINV